MDRDGPFAFADLISGAVWLVLAATIVVLSWHMDRLVHLQVSIYTAPGLVPGILGVALAIMGTILVGRSLRRGALRDVSVPSFGILEHWRLLVTLVLALAFAAGLVGSGLPFWLATALYVAAAVFVFRRADGPAGVPPWRPALFAAVYGLIAGGAIFYLFQNIFLVRLP